MKSGKVLCLYPRGESHGFTSDFLGQVQVIGQ